MKVSPINYFSNIQPYKKSKNTGIGMSNVLACDTVSFKGCDLLDLPKEEIYKRVQESLTFENFLGQGTEAEVYRIKGTDYCVKIPYEVLGVYSKGANSMVKNWYCNKNIQSCNKVNHVVMELSYNAKVMKYFDGERPKDYITNQDGRYKLQSKIAQMPQKSYTEFLHKIAEGIDNEMLFDYSGGNLIVNTKENKLTLIDFMPISETPRKIKPLVEMYSVITAYGAERETGKKIFENVITAALDEFEPKQIPCMDAELFDFVDLCEKRIFDSKAQNTEKLMQKITYQVNTLKELKTKEYLHGLFSKFIGEKIFEIKNLIKYIK